MSFLTTKQGEGIKFKEIDNKTRGGVGWVGIKFKEIDDQVPIERSNWKFLKVKGGNWHKNLFDNKIENTYPVWGLRLLVLRPFYVCYQRGASCLDTIKNKSTAYWKSKNMLPKSSEIVQRYTQSLPTFFEGLIYVWTQN